MIILKKVLKRRKLARFLRGKLDFLIKSLFKNKWLLTNPKIEGVSQQPVTIWQAIPYVI
jgi:hypothetical protein